MRETKLQLSSDTCHCQAPDPKIFDVRKKGRQIERRHKGSKDENK